MPTKLERMNNIYYNEPYNSDNFFEIHYCQQFSNIPWEFPEGRYMEFYAQAKNDYFMVYTTSGMSIQNESQLYELNSHELLIWKPNGKQSITHHPSDKSSFYVFIFSGKCCEEILNSLNLKINQIYRLTRNQTLPDFSKQIGYIAHELRNKDNEKYNSYIASTMFLEFLGIYSRYISQSHDSENVNAIKSIKEYIDQHPQIKHNIEELIKSSHLSRSTFYTMFKKYTGMSILQYINDLKLSKAVDYMVLLNFSVTEAASVMGFDDPLYFGRLFKRKFKMTPTEYKKKHTVINHNITL